MEGTMNRVAAITGLAVAAALASASVAHGHVTVQPDRAPAGGFVRLDVRVPNERDDASTTRVAVQLPDGFAEASYEPVPGWTVKLKKAKLATPIKTDEGEVTEGVKQVTWTSRRGIPPDAFQDFGLSVQIPGQAGQTLTFKALQTYSDGEIVRWIGANDSDAPAPTVSVGAAGGDTERAAADSSAPEGTDAGGSDTVAIVALGIGALGLAAGAAGLVAARRAARVTS
jgi:uncharacterized protein YcnI